MSSCLFSVEMAANPRYMRLLNSFAAVLIFGLFIGVLNAQIKSENQDRQRVFSLLQSYRPHVNWSLASVLTSDFDHDGIDDFAFSVNENGNFVVAIIHGLTDNEPKYWVSSFEIVKPSRNIHQICSIDAKIRPRSPVILGSEKRMWQIPAQSKAISLDDGCDPIDISWDQDKKDF